MSAATQRLSLLLNFFSMYFVSGAVLLRGQGLGGARLSDPTCPLIPSAPNPHDYKHVAKAVEIADSTGQAYFLSGGTGMALLRFGAPTIKPQPHSDEKFTFDIDLDFMVVTSSDLEHAAFCRKVVSKCLHAGIFDSCDPCGMGMHWNPGTTNMTQPGMPIRPHAVFYDVREQLDGTFKVAWPQRWIIKRDVIFPMQKAKYYDVSVPMVHQPLKFYSNAVPYYPRHQFPEYGSGCDGMAYPYWLTSKATWDIDQRENSPTSKAKGVKGLGISSEVLRQCASALETSGFASFSECFPSPEASKDD